MGGTTGGHTSRTERSEHIDGGVVVERTVEYVERGAIVTLTAGSRSTERTGFSLVEEFPSELPVSDAGFQAGTEPVGGYVSGSGARIEETVAPDEERRVVYALQFYESAPDVDLGEPDLTAGGARSTVGETSSVRARGGSGSTAATSPDADVGGGRRLPTARADGGREAVPGNDAPEAGGEPRAAADGSGATEVVDADGAPDGDGAVPTVDRVDASEAADRVEEAVETVERIGPTADAVVTPDDGVTDGEQDERDEPGEGVVAELVAELRDGAVSDRERAALRRELGVGHAGPEDVRIEHLESRMSEFAAYAEALREVIDEHGTAEAFVGRFEDRIDGLRADLEAVESELSATRETVAGVESHVERLEDELEAVEERTGADLEALRAEVDERHGRNAEAVETVEDRVRTIEDRVETVEAFRERFAAVFEDSDDGPA
jgi:archaellum component FlaC